MTRYGWIVLLAGLAACGGDDEGAEQTAAGRPAARDSVVRQPVYPEAEAAEIFRVLNESEVNTARVARERSQNADILRFASVMSSDHEAMTQLLDSLLPAPADTVLKNAQARALRQENAQLVDSLWAIMGGFNNTYMEHQVRDHERALILLDTALIPSARTPEVKRLLMQLRPAVAAHLQRARQIYSARMADPELAAPTRAQPEPRPEPVQPTPQPLPQPVIPRDTGLIQPVPSSTSNM